MGRNRKWIQVLILTAVAVIGALAIGQSLFFHTGFPEEGGDAPSFALTGTDNRKHELSDYRGKIVVINFWGTFCPPCKNEMPAIQRQYNKWNEQGVEVLGINLGESAVTVQSFLREHNLTFPVLYDPDLTIRNAYGVSQYPTTFFVNQEGEIEIIKVGEMSEAFIDQTIVSMLENR